MLRWDLQWGAAQKTWDALIEQGKTLPPQHDEMPDRPDLAEHLVLLWNEFWELSTERQIGMAAGQIPASKIRDRASELGFDEELDADRFFALIRRMDAAYLEPKATSEIEVDGGDHADPKRAFVKLGTGKRFKRTKKKL